MFERCSWLPVTEVVLMTGLLCCSVVIQCTYALEGLHRFFWTYMFESETAGVGRILYAKEPSEGMWAPNVTLTSKVA